MGRPDIFRYITIAAYAIGNDASLGAAQALMREHGIRHLPVMQGGVVVGVISEGDVLLLESEDRARARAMTVERAMTPHPYVVPPDAFLDEVVEHMIEHEIGSAVVVEDGRLVGMFTATDALRALAEMAFPEAPDEPRSRS
ncbi:CBS domain-containing protein [Haliangium sp.]|uniref:CBS domain-containing protein n=1 Tax=Haliangium sp. TaxID=2663208 RepID=UPI003D0A0D58